MSASVMGAVMTSGPTRLRLCLALVGIADNADDFGFAQLSIATIASKARCDQRTAMRVVQALEREGWLKVYRRVVEGKGSVYIIDIAKLGIVPDAKSRKSQWHVAFERGMKLSCEQEIKAHSGDKMSPELLPKKGVEGKSLTLKRVRELSAEASKSGDKMSPEKVDSPFLPAESGDNSQGVQVTFCPDSGDISSVPILKNHRTIRTQTKNPPTPLGAGERANGWTAEQNLAFEADQRVLWVDCNRVRAKCGESPWRWEDFIADAHRNRPAPPPPTTDAEFDACKSAEDAARLLMQREAIAGSRLASVIAGAVKMHTLRSSLPVAEVGYLAWQRYRSYADRSGTMRFSWGPMKFFAEGHVWNPGSWPIDSKPKRL